MLMISMDISRGVSITQFCDENRLTPRERLELFVHVCQAVQHAHQKGIIHRDLKATNIHVTLHDGTPVVVIPGLDGCTSFWCLTHATPMHAPRPALPQPVLSAPLRLTPPHPTSSLRIPAELPPR